MLVATPSWADTQILLQDSIREALKDYDFAQKNGDKMDICLAAREVESAYRMARQAEDFKEWKLHAKDACNQVQAENP